MEEEESERSGRLAQNLAVAAVESGARQRKGWALDVEDPWWRKRSGVLGTVQSERLLFRDQVSQHGWRSERDPCQRSLFAETVRVVV